MRILSLGLVLVFTLAFTIAGCDSVEPDQTEEAVAPMASAQENCTVYPATWTSPTTYWREVNGQNYQISENSYQCLCQNSCDRY